MGSLCGADQYSKFGHGSSLGEKAYNTICSCENARALHLDWGLAILTHSPHVLVLSVPKIVTQVTEGFVRSPLFPFQSQDAFDCTESHLIGRNVISISGVPFLRYHTF